MPVAVQVVSYAFQDELALGVMKVIDDKVNYQKFPAV